MYASVSRPISVASTPAVDHAHTWASPRCSRSMSPRWKRRVHRSSGSSHCARKPEKRGRPGSASGSTARSNAAATWATSPSAGPHTRSSCATAPARRAAKIVAASVRVQPSRTPATTTAGLNTPKAEATTSGSTWPSNDPRLVK